MPFPRLVSSILLLCGACAPLALAAEVVADPLLIDLPTALRLAGAEPLAVQIAQEQLAQAHAQAQAARWKFLPTLSPGLNYQAQGGNAQTVDGRIIDVTKESYGLGLSLVAKVDLGSAWYQRLATHQRALAAEQAVKQARQRTLLAASAAWFALARAQADIGLERDATQILTDYSNQLTHAVSSGVSSSTQALRVQTLIERSKLAARRASEEQQLAVARISEILNLELDPGLGLHAPEQPFLALELGQQLDDLKALIDKAWAQRPEMTQAQALIQATHEEALGAERGAWIPTLSAGASIGGLGGGPDHERGSFGETHAVFVGASWTIGTGGLLDQPARNSADSRNRESVLRLTQTRLSIQRETSEAVAQVRSLKDQLAIAANNVITTEQILSMNRARQTFGVGDIFEFVQSQEDALAARREHTRIIADYNTAQYRLMAVVGDLR